MNKRRRNLTNRCRKLKRAMFHLKSTSSMSLDERFSEILANQLTQSSSMTFTGFLSDRSKVVKGHNRVSAVSLQCQRSRSVWTRIGWQRKCLCVSASKQGFWSFMKKYRSRFRRVSLQRWQRQRQSSSGRDIATTQSTIKKTPVPTKQQLDAQLDAYMSMSKTRLDQQLEDYMSKSKRRLDEQLDEYMAMAGQTTLWE